MTVSPEAEAIRTRIKELMRSTLQLEAPLATRRVQYEATMSRGHLKKDVNKNKKTWLRLSQRARSFFN